jgi:hypothetical protein
MAADRHPRLTADPACNLTPVLCDGAWLSGSTASAASPPPVWFQAAFADHHPGELVEGIRPGPADRGTSLDLEAAEPVRVDSRPGLGVSRDMVLKWRGRFLPDRPAGWPMSPGPAGPGATRSAHVPGERWRARRRPADARRCWLIASSPGWDFHPFPALLDTDRGVSEPERRRVDRLAGGRRRECDGLAVAGEVDLAAVAGLRADHLQDLRAAGVGHVHGG